MSATVQVVFNLGSISSIVMTKMSALILLVQMDTVRIPLDHLYANVKRVLSWLKMVLLVLIETSVLMDLMAVVMSVSIMLAGKCIWK